MKRIAAGLLLSAISGSAWATCGSLPYTLTNGTVANADQVMADLNCLALTGVGVFSSGIQTQGTSFGINRNTSTGAIYDTGRYAYQWQQFGSTSAGSDNLVMQTYAPGGGSGPTPFAIDALGRFAVNYSTTNPSWTFFVNGTSAGTTDFQISSDERLKKNIIDVTGGLDAIMQLRPVRFSWKATAERTIGKKLNFDSAPSEVGFLAQDVAKVIPEAVTVPAKPEDEPYSLMPTRIIPFLVEAIKEQQAEIQALKDQVAALKTPQ